MIVCKIYLLNPTPLAMGKFNTTCVISLDQVLSSWDSVRSTVRLRFKNGISIPHSQTIGKLASIDFKYHTGVINSI